jgi:AMP deaminase
VEWRISIYGRQASEWAALAQWFYQHRLAHKNVRWMVQTPRLYHVYKSNNQIASFGEMVNNIFAPLFEITLGLTQDPALQYFLNAVVGFDSVDDESIPEMELLNAQLPPPDQYTAPHNPPYAYWMYYMYANLCKLNQLRASRGLNTFQYRPHSGEAGDVDHLISTYLLAHHVNHGILLRKNSPLQYLYYLSQVGVAMSPLCNSKIFLDCKRNPFHRFFQVGLNVSLSTDGPLMLHYSKDALLEEYSTASQMWNMKSADLCEVARLSVLQSGVELALKKAFLGENMDDSRLTNVPEIRLKYRQEALDAELSLL